MRKTPLGAGWTQSPSPVLQGQSAEPTTAQRTATYATYPPSTETHSSVYRRSAKNRLEKRKCEIVTAEPNHFRHTSKVRTQLITTE